MAGFPDTKFAGIVVRITETTRMTAIMKVGVVSAVVEVQSQVEQVNTTDATTGQSLGAQTITDLPLATRNFQQLLTLSAGASSDLNGAAQLGRGTVYMHVNGGREDNNNYLDRRHHRGGLCLRRIDLHTAAQSGRDPGIQSQHQSLRRYPGA